VEQLRMRQSVRQHRHLVEGEWCITHVQGCYHSDHPT
jgi:hypothetical protein